jgi:hypothetical protein
MKLLVLCFSFLLSLGALADSTVCNSAVTSAPNEIGKGYEISLPGERKLVITQLGESHASDPNLQLRVLDSDKKVVLSQRLERLVPDGGRDYHLISFSPLCKGETSGVILAFEAGGTGSSTLFIFVSSNKTGVAVKRVAEAVTGRLAIDPASASLRLYDVMETDADYKDPKFSCDFCPKYYRETVITLNGSSSVKGKPERSRKRLSPQDFVDHPLVIKQTPN